MNALLRSGTDKILLSAYNQGIIMSGNSAGGCVWFESYANEEDDDFDGTMNTYKTKPALGFVCGFFEPHWNTKFDTGIDTDSTSKDAVETMLIRESKFGYGVDGGAAIMVQTKDEKQTISVITSKPGARVYRLNFDTQKNPTKNQNMER